MSERAQQYLWGILFGFVLILIVFFAWKQGEKNAEPVTVVVTATPAGTPTLTVEELNATIAAMQTMNAGAVQHMPTSTGTPLPPPVVTLATPFVLYTQTPTPGQVSLLGVTGGKESLGQTSAPVPFQFLNVPQLAQDVEIPDNVRFFNPHPELVLFAEPGHVFNQGDINPTTQGVFETVGPSHFTLREGKWAFFSTHHTNLEVGGATFYLPGDEDGKSIVLGFVRGLYADGDTPNDRNLTMTFSNYSPGNIQAISYGDNGGFLSLGQLDQILTMALGESPDCGYEGCRTAYLFLHDANTKATAFFVYQDGAWVELFRNFNLR